ncbi:endonuclease toxin domain-containing protein [Verminephrobacter aporrectodeae]|uniref:CdiA toxin EC869-like domain-containing protein n=1 Tax=Verminephrobacter aporrectodeae subsp. tuberculatae TaxID=1110392 RepID=A0ABT3KRI4_9BURK|nr:hypothetical protein [Verminephrobacter aporrectodeae]MCW5255911.1 hypothetical protein [Verminephrobacter aporrectodeae subsp. tuberculatae]MCW5320925.1 hypothetical protein [Verminephrobacter aporrectodeae subsp. tuberculatae]MCW8165605.1 hypothetical protein [Verminephrobacter aporrectodeae subsp. tuberculatae]MCW8168412.1 hypothetical protein [Verminephrobacter aporrectodeae subsp. tuberculatae]MCW8175685.1 hypothetical protein [Verminephrobacter aporrectodeae subsp. tuberculatae]
MLDGIQHNHKTFDYYDPTMGRAVSIKAMDTLGLSGSKPMLPGRAAGYLRRYVAKVVDYKKAGQSYGIEKADIQLRFIELAIPGGTSIKVREALDKVAREGLVQGVRVSISVIMK